MVHGIKVFLIRRLIALSSSFLGAKGKEVSITTKCSNYLKYLKFFNSFCTKVGKGNCQSNGTDTVDVDPEEESLPFK